MGDITTETILLGGILVTLVFIGGVLWKVLKAVNDIADAVAGDNDPNIKHPRKP